MSAQLPQAFVERMAARLKDELPAFLRSYEEPYCRGIRFSAGKAGPSCGVARRCGRADPLGTGGAVSGHGERRGNHGAA